MGIKQYRSKSKETDGSEVLGDEHHKLARDQLVPRIAERNRRAVLTDRRHFLYYQKRLAGRKCSCLKASSSPSGHCQVCFGNGVVGGYDKYGTVSETFDVTYPNMVAVNVRPDFESESRPTMLTLDPMSLKGHIELSFEVKPSLARGNVKNPWDAVDIIQTISTIRKGNNVRTLIRAPSENRYVDLTEQSLGKRLNEHKLLLRVELSRESYDRQPPLLSHVFLRYLLIEDPQIKMDIPRQNESVTLAEYGIFDSFSTLSAWLATDLQRIGTEDFFYRLEDGSYWKTIESSPNKPLGQLTSHDLVLRLIQHFEAYVKVP